MYVEGIKYVNLIEIGVVVIEMQGVENGKLVVLVNNTLVWYKAFLAADTRSCVLMIFIPGSLHQAHESYNFCNKFDHKPL